MTGLKYECEKNLASSLTFKTVIGRLIFAEKQKAEELKSTCIEFITKNNLKVMPSNDFKMLIRDHPELAFEVICYLTTSLGKLQLNN